jgi:hypothetical protein
VVEGLAKDAAVPFKVEVRKPQGHLPDSCQRVKVNCLFCGSKLWQILDYTTIWPGFSIGLIKRCY